jgi:hypothetical protein
MTSILLAISLILHLYTFFWIITLMQKMKSQPSENINYEKIKEEIEDILLAYTTEMKEENEKLVLEVKKIKAENNQVLKQLEFNPKIRAVPHDRVIESINQNRSTPMTQKVSPLTKSTRMSPQPKENNEPPSIEEYSDYQPPTIEDEKADIFEQSDTVKVLSLAKRGFNSEQIAKKLKLGKGEVELILKFYS